MPSQTYKFPEGSATYIVDIDWQTSWSDDESDIVDIEFRVSVAEDGEEVLITDDPSLFWECDPYLESSVYQCLVQHNILLRVEPSPHVSALEQILTR